LNYFKSYKSYKKSEFDTKITRLFVSHLRASLDHTKAKHQTNWRTNICISYNNIDILEVNVSLVRDYICWIFTESPGEKTPRDEPNKGTWNKFFQ